MFVGVWIYEVLIFVVCVEVLYVCFEYVGVFEVVVCFVGFFDDVFGE